jgi:uncharacterized membrane protein YsdA (DUF1294 family)
MALELVVGWLIAINALSASFFAWDKHQARKGGWRVRERSLLYVAFLGGSPAALASQQLLRHKTYKEPFRTRLWSVASFHALLIVGLAVAGTFRRTLG